MPSTTIGPPDDQGRFPTDSTAAGLAGHGWAGWAATGAPLRPGLLVSVRSVEEARIAADWGADVVDLKEPSRGALGAADADVWQAVAAAMPATVCLSAALGEARQCDTAALQRLPGRFRFAKAGPAGLAEVQRLTRHWRALAAGLSGGSGQGGEAAGATTTTQLVAVGYADHQAAQCPPPEAVLRAAAGAGLRWWLLDTLVKDGRSVVDHLGIARLRAIDRLAHDHHVRWVLAGSLRRHALAALADLRPALFGVRGDVCRGGRSGPIDGQAIAQWQQRLATVQSRRRGPASSN